MTIANTQIDPGFLGATFEQSVYQGRTMTFRVTFRPLWDASIQGVHSSSVFDQATEVRKCCARELCHDLASVLLEYRIKSRATDKVGRSLGLGSLSKVLGGNQYFAMAEAFHGCLFPILFSYLRK
jgi:hypothetical protein